MGASASDGSVSSCCKAKSLKSPILSKLKCPGFFHDNRGLGAM